MPNKPKKTNFITSYKKMYALVGNFGFAPGPKGLSVYSYDAATARMELIETAFDNVNVGHLSVNAERKIAYIIDECPSLRGQTGGGGYLIAVKIDPASGKTSLVNEKPTLSQEPCYTCLDKTKRYILVSHHADFGFVTKIVKGEKGYSTETVFDDTALVLFRINEDGSLGEACDVSITSSGNAAGPHVWSRQHSVVVDPTGELFIVCDQGLDKFHTYHLDQENGKLIQLQDTTVETGLAPRYSTFHPTLPIFYANFEKKAIVRAYRNDIATGKLDLIGSVPSLLDDKEYGLTDEKEKELKDAGCWIDSAYETFHTVDPEHKRLPGTHLMLTLSRPCLLGGMEKITREWIGYGLKDGKVWRDTSTSAEMLCEAYLHKVMIHATVEAQQLNKFLPELYAEYKDKPDDVD